MWEGMQLADAGTLVMRLVENTSKNGNLLLNISPRADGTIPQEQQDILLGIGKWLDVNGEAIYGSRPWVKYGEGPAAEAAAQTMTQIRAAGFAGRTNEKNLGGPLVAGGGVPRKGYTAHDFRFTTRGDTLYALGMAWPGASAVVTSLASGNAGPGKVQRVELLGHAGALQFTQDAGGLKVTLPTERPCDYAYTLKITGLSLHTKGTT